MKNARQLKKFLKNNGIKVDAEMNVKGYSHDVTHINGKKVLVEKPLKTKGYGCQFMSIRQLLKEVKKFNGMKLRISCYVYPTFVSLAVKSKEWQVTSVGETTHMLSVNVYYPSTTIW